jgi:hypothetical protein
LPRFLRCVAPRTKFVRPKKRGHSGRNDRVGETTGNWAVLPLLGKQFGLAGGGCDGGFAAGDADDAEDVEGREGGAGNEDAVGIGVEVGRSELDAVVEEREQVVGDDAFEGFAVGVTEADPKAIELRAGEEGFAFGLEVAIEFADEVERADVVERDLLVRTVGREEVERVDLAEAGRVEVALQDLAVHERDNDLLVRRGWGSELQTVAF